MQSSGTPARHPLIRLLAFAFLISMALGLLAEFPLMFGFNFLPSYKWASVANAFGIVIGLMIGAVMVWVGWRDRNKSPDGKLKKGMVIFLAAPLVGVLIGRNSALLGLPMIAALVVGHHVEASFVVADAHDFGSRHCRRPVELRDLPSMYNRICRVSSEFRKSVSPGTEVKVTGYGTALGFFVQDISRAD